MKIASSERETLRWAWRLAILFNVIYGVILILLLWVHDFPNPKPIHIALLVFLAMGLALLVWAIRETVLWKAYGETLFLSEVDIFPWGGRLHGKISFPRAPASMGRHFRLSLFCEGVLGVQGQQHYTAWHDSHSVDLAPDGIIPVLFSLPAEINLNPCYNGMIWKLNVKEIGGGFRSFAAQYLDLPVEEAPEKDPFKDEP
jgi:hypothetical protein